MKAALSAAMLFVLECVMKSVWRRDSGTLIIYLYLRPGRQGRVLSYQEDFRASV